MDNKKVLGISIAAVVILVIAIVATSYAAFTANITGTKENKLSTGYVKLNCAATTFTVNDVNPMTDAQGIGAENNAATCTLTSTMDGSMTVGYDIALDDVDTTTPSDALGVNNVKIQASKTIDEASPVYLAGTSASTGVLVNSIAGAAGVHDTSITAYTLDSATLKGNHTVVYTVKAWVAEGAEGGAITNSENTSGVCSDPTYETESTCETAGGIWGTSQTATQAGSSFSFKLKLGATQVYE